MMPVMEKPQTSAPSRKRVWHAPAAGLLVLLVAMLGIAGLYLTVPKGNEGSGPVDALVVLGTPAGMHGELTEMQRWRVDEGVREYKRGAAPRVLFSGGPTSHGIFEADVMSAYAIRSGVPAGAVLEDRWAFTTVDNIRNSAALLRLHGWTSVEVVSTAQHLPRAGLLLEKTGLRWRTHAAPTPDRGWADTTVAWVEEAVGTAALRLFGTRVEPVLHTVARGQHGVGYCVRWVLFRVQDLGRR